MIRKGFFIRHMFSWTSRENNKLASDMTQYALGDPNLVWIEGEPDFLNMNRKSN